MMNNLTRSDAARIARETPWKLSNELIRMAWLPLVRLRFAAAGVDWNDGWLIYGLPILQRHREANIQVGTHLELRSFYASNPLAPNHAVMLTAREAGASLTIGDHVGMTGGGIVCALEVTIGNYVTIGANTIITDTDFHPLDPAVRRIRPMDAKTAPVVIEDDVFIGMQSIILKGVTIGTGSVIGAGSVVTSDIPPGVIAAGNPAKVIRAV